MCWANPQQLEGGIQENTNKKLGQKQQTGRKRDDQLKRRCSNVLWAVREVAAKETNENDEQVCNEGQDWISKQTKD